MIKFEKISFNQFNNDVIKMGFDDKIVKESYDIVTLPTRATSGSAGYDYICPFLVYISPGQEVIIPTGIRCTMPKNVVHSIYPRSGLGFKYRMRLSNTVGIIDSDYYYSDNEGHIMIKISNEGDKQIIINPGDRFAQGIFTKYYVTDDDNVNTERNGGFGSTDNN